MRVLGSHAGTLAYVLILVSASLVPVTVYWANTNSAQTALHIMRPFNSLTELQQYFLTQNCPSPAGLSNRNPLPQPPATSGQSTTTSYTAGPSTSSVPTHSETNAQVAGVDELDTVKNDGTYIYTVTNNSVAIVLAYPVSEAKLLTKVSVNGSLQGIFVDGNRLVAVSQQPEYYPYPIIYAGSTQAILGTVVSYPIFSGQTTSSVWIFDISDHSHPVLTTTLLMNGTLAGARLIGERAYIITTEQVYCHESILPPVNIINGQPAIMAPGEIYHSDIADYSNSFTTIVGINIGQPNPTPTAKSFLIGTSSNIYVSTDQIYLTQPIWSKTEETAVHRISIQGSSIIYEATGTVPGHVLNQFSMDENNGYFRIATTYYAFAPVPAQGVGATTIIGSQQQTNLYVLDSGLHIIGRLEGLSPGESFYAARFMGDRAYLVTYQRMDPLFVIGLHDPSRPRVLGQLNITGVSDYLQPYDENHLIGLGKSSTNVTWENAALFQGLKLSLFDVTDPSNPADISNFLVGDRGSDSPALKDHRAVLFDSSLNLLVIPLEIAQAQQNPASPWSYNPIVWQGAYVFNVTVQGGLVFRGGITQVPTGELPYSHSAFYVTRALYIRNVLYTVSNGMVKMNSIADLAGLGAVSLS